MAIKKTVSKAFVFLFIITAALLIIEMVGVPSFISAPFMEVQTIVFFMLSPILIVGAIIFILILLVFLN